MRDVQAELSAQRRNSDESWSRDLVPAGLGGPQPKRVPVGDSGVKALALVGLWRLGWGFGPGVSGVQQGPGPVGANMPPWDSGFV